MSSNGAFSKGQRNVCACINMWICVCAYGTDARRRPFDVSPDGPGQLAGEEQSRGHQRVGPPSPGACSFPPPLSLPSPSSSDQYRVLITKDSTVVLPFSHLLSPFFLLSVFTTSALLLPASINPTHLYVPGMCARTCLCLYVSTRTHTHAHTRTHTHTHTHTHSAKVSMHISVRVSD